jgi:hypothetical protein
LPIWGICNPYSEYAFHGEISAQTPYKARKHVGTVYLSRVRITDFLFLRGRFRRKRHKYGRMLPHTRHRKGQKKRANPAVARTKNMLAVKCSLTGLWV